MAAYWAGVGAAAGVLIGSYVGERGHDNIGGEIGALLGFVGGGTAGAVVGFLIAPETWSPVNLWAQTAGP